MTSPAGWLSRIQQLGSAYFAVLRAELAAALEDLQASGRSLLRAALLFTITVALGFWTVGLLVYFLIEMLALRLPRWGAVGVVFALFVVGTVAFAAAAVSRLRRIEAPAALLERRWRDHAAWWQSRIGEKEDAASGGARRSGDWTDDEDDPRGER